MLYDNDPYLMPFKAAIDARHERILACKEHLAGGKRLCDVVNNHLYYGLHKTAEGWVFREWAPNASRIWLIGEFNNWKRADAYALKPIGGGNWEITLPAMFLTHGELYKLFIEWPGGGGEEMGRWVGVGGRSVRKMRHFGVWIFFRIFAFLTRNCIFVYRYEN